MADTLIHLPIDRLPLVSLCDDLWTEDGFVHPDRVMDVNVLLYVREGEFEIYEEGERYVVPAGSVFFLKQELHHWGRKHCPRGTRWFFVHFHLPEQGADPADELRAEDFAYVEGSEPTQTSAVYVPIPKLVHLPPKSMLVARFESLLSMYRSNEPQERAYMTAFLYRLLLDIRYEAEASRPVAPQTLRTRQLKQLMENLVSSPFSAREVEERMGLSYKHLSFCFKEETGMTLQEYHTKLRMERAALLLRRGGLSIRQISEQLGFAEPFYFTTVFKKQMGCSPSEYRKGAIRI
jgi:AraC-like DNA-binding protein